MARGTEKIRCGWPLRCPINIAYHHDLWEGTLRWVDFCRQLIERDVPALWLNLEQQQPRRAAELALQA